MNTFDINEMQSQMNKAIEQLINRFSKIRTGRASASILDEVMIDYYGNPTSISQVASITIENNRSILVSPWEKKLLIDIERAIASSQLNLNPSSQNDIIRINLPPLTEETRSEYSKQAKKEAENIKVSIRNIRRDFNNTLKDLKKNSEINEDELKTNETQTQKITDECIQRIDELSATKINELRTI